MADDNQNKSFERLDETRYERNERSFFDWLTGRKETEEEKLKKKLDKELKEAARKRAEQFEEELRQQEERDVAETKKLKKRWRKKLVEKSEKQLADAEQKDENEMNGYEIAQVMVAERIVKLHEMLNDESLDLRRSEIKALKINLYFMGLLSEKLSRPELEVPEEVEKLYQTIATSIEDTTGETEPEPSDSNGPTTPENTPSSSEPASSEEAETPPASEADTNYTAFAVVIVNAIRRTLKKSPAPEKSNSTEKKSSEQSSEPAASPLSSKSNEDNSQSQAPESLLDSVRRTAFATEDIRQEISHAATVKRMAEIVEKAEMMNPVKRQPSAPETAATVAAVVASTERLKQTEQKPQKISAAESFPDISIELWNEADLVRKAEQVDIGNGRRLASAYRNGEIDREGLIKVLKSHKKHKNHLEEFRHQASRWRQSREFSPENLKNISEQSQQTAPLPAPETPQDLTSRQISKPSTARQLLRKVTSQPFSEIEPRMRDARDQVKKQASFVMMLSSLLLLIMLVVIIWFINSL